MPESVSAITLREAQESVDKWIRTVGVRYFSELTNLGILMEEVGELSRLIVRKYGDQSFKDSDKGKKWLMKWLMCFGYSFAWLTRQVLILPMHLKKIFKRKITGMMKGILIMIS